MDEKLWQNSVLFRGTSADQMQHMLDCLQAKRCMYEKGAVIFCAGETTNTMGLVLSGSVNIEFDDMWGNKTILDNAAAGQVFAETYACLPDEPMLVSAVAAERTKVLLLRGDRLLHPCESACPHHERLIRNMLRAAAQKNLVLSRRMFHISSKTIRGRLLSYLSEQAILHGAACFAIPFDRQQLADYLGVDRSALSAEMGRMRDEGLISFHKNRFSLRPDMGGEQPSGR